MTDTTKTSDKIKTRTIVGSPPHRRQLRGREAIERALAHARSWDCADARSASRRAFYARGRAGGQLADWLPPRVRILFREQLERLLDGGTVEGPDGGPMGIDEVAP